ncbi:cytochrome P450 2J6-like isoform X2 [Haliotis rubra]|uniref:cytochrome P450 2J6-like isoform X2 n=1 Tax=Haliotis rubra TaxID=36100 RepID=UPI001EE58E01|nr:cytochrome P450 2J6-like isoform X2 [Haliotis rubra]
MQQVDLSMSDSSLSTSLALYIPLTRRSSWVYVHAQPTGFPHYALLNHQSTAGNMLSLLSYIISPGYAAVVAVVAAVVSAIMFLSKGRRELPPGPRGVPVLGAFPFWKGPETNFEWTKEYGNIYSVKMLNRLNVYLNDIDLVTEYMIRQGHLYEDRPAGPAAIAQGLLFGSGSHWKLNRKLATSITWKEGSQKAFESMFRRELEAILPKFNQEGPMYLSDIVRPYISNVIVTVLRGQRYPDDDPEMQHLLKVLTRLDDVDLTSMATLLGLAFPRASSKLCPNSPNLHGISSDMQSVVRGWIMSEAPRTDKDNTFISKFTQSDEYKDENADDKEMVQSMLDMFFGGVTSFMSLIEYLVLFLLHDPKLQTRIQEQIHDVIGKRPVTLEDRENLSLVEASIIEALRIGSITTSSLPHVSVEDTQIGDYHIPKGTSVVASLYSLHRDPKYFPEPEVFKPERHIDANGVVTRPKSFLPFGVGPRLCVGDTMVRVGVFMFFTTIMQNYTITPVVVGSPPPFSSRLRIVRRLEPYQVVLVPRN